MVGRDHGDVERGDVVRLLVADRQLRHEREVLPRGVRHRSVPVPLDVFFRPLLAENTNKAVRLRHMLYYLG